MVNKLLTHQAMGSGRGCTHLAYEGGKKNLTRKTALNWVGKERGGAERDQADGG